MRAWPSTVCCVLFALILGVPTGSASARDSGGVAAFERGDFQHARAALRKPAQDGDVRSQFLLGRLLLRYADIEGLRWVRSAARGNHLPAQVWVAMMRVSGAYLKPDALAHVTWLKRAVSHDAETLAKHPVFVAQAYYWLSEAYRDGFGVLVDLEGSAEYMRLSADAGNPVAQFGYGELLHQGMGVERDVVEAHKYYVLSWKQDHKVEVFGQLVNPGRMRALELRSKMTVDELDRSRAAIREWLERQKRGELGFAHRIDVRISRGERRLVRDEAQEREVIAGLRALASNETCALPWLHSRKPVRGSPDQKVWIEHWTIDSCGRRRTLPIEFHHAPDGAWKPTVREELIVANGRPPE